MFAAANLYNTFLTMQDRTKIV